jgi:hypothetical protein
MKKLGFVAVLILLTASVGLSQGIKKGNLIGIHIFSIKLNPGITMEQFTNFCLTKYIPAYEKNMPGAKGYLAKRIRGQQDQAQYDIALIFVFGSDKERSKYFTTAEGGMTELGKAASKKMEPIEAEWSKLGTFSEDGYTDWIIQ